MRSRAKKGRLAETNRLLMIQRMHLVQMRVVDKTLEAYNYRTLIHIMYVHIN